MNTLSQALVLAAGRGERMRPLTDHTPKPLLTVSGKPLITYTLENLARAGVQQALINTAWLEDQFVPTLGFAYEGMRLEYSHEGQDSGGALETLGGIARALPRLSDVFWVIAGDVYAPDFDFSSTWVQTLLADACLARLFLVPNPEHNPQGDFVLTPLGSAGQQTERYTFSTIALYKKTFFSTPRFTIPQGNPHHQKAALAPLLHKGLEEGVVSTLLYQGKWMDIGTPQRLDALNAEGRAVE